MRTNESIINEILNNRGITDSRDIEEFLSDNPRRTYDPFLLDGMEEGIELLVSVAAAGGRICIYGDYDADGVTSVTVMGCGISRITSDWFYYIPSRFKEGYGLNLQAVDRIKAAGADLLITVDCGCVSYNEVEYAKSIGLKVIVTDHHNIENVMADCIVIDPKKPGNKYPCRDLAGCGVAFKFIQALQRRAGLPKSILSEALDMVAIGTVGDIVPLKDENRTLVKYGIAAANTGRRKALAKLAEAVSVNEINSENIAFAIVPHINATGRMESAMTAAELFNTDSDSVIDEKIAALIRCNSERKRIQEAAYEKCVGMVSENEDFIVLSIPDMHEGIAGIVAGKLKDRFGRPVIIVTPSTGEGKNTEGITYLKGTGRSIPSVDIYDVLNRHSELFVRFGGHRSACGFLMKEAHLEELRKNVNSEVRRMHENMPDLFEIPVETDTYIEPGEVSIELARDLQKLAPFGEGNPNPRFLLKEVKLHGLSYMGENRTHVRFSACSSDASAEDGRSYVNCVLFRKAQEVRPLLESGTALTLAGSISYQIWRGQERVQFIVEEIIA